MFSLKINLIGCDEEKVPLAARERLQRWAVMDEDLASMKDFQSKVLQKEGETRLLVVSVGNAHDVAALKRLNTSYPCYPILAVVDSTEDSSLVTKCLRAGAMQVVHPPVDGNDLQEALDCIASKHAGLGTLAKQIAVVGASGGCGCTTVAINLSYELARVTKQRCILMEMALRKGTVANYLDVTPRYTVTDLICDLGRVDSFILQGALTEVAENFSVLVGPYDAIQADPIDLEDTMQFVGMVRHFAPWLVLDIPTAYDELFFRSLNGADQIVIVAEQTVAAIRGVQIICESLKTSRPIVVINRYSGKRNSLSLTKIQQFLPNCDICTLAYDDSVIAATNAGKPLRVQSPKSPILADLGTLVQKLETKPNATGDSEKSQSILGRISRALSLS
jgi:pilus assembly protein CpaE